MATFLFDSTIFGPVSSRRLGASLGINLLPNNKKVCNFDCIYCECGLTNKTVSAEKILKSKEIKILLEKRLKLALDQNEKIDTITFAGNGEPTLHPEFPKIMDDVRELRSRLFPSAKIAVLSNSTFITNERIFHALIKADYNILKLDSAISETQQFINCPAGNFDLNETIENLRRFNGNLIIQTLFLRGQINGKMIDNTTPEELSEWLKALNRIKPESVMIYTIARETPVKGLEKISLKELNTIADRVKKEGHRVHVSS